MVVRKKLTIRALGWHWYLEEADRCRSRLEGAGVAHKGYYNNFGFLALEDVDCTQPNLHIDQTNSLGLQ